MNMLFVLMENASLQDVIEFWDQVYEGIPVVSVEETTQPVHILDSLIVPLTFVMDTPWRLSYQPMHPTSSSDMKGEEVALKKIQETF